MFKLTPTQETNQERGLREMPDHAKGGQVGHQVPTPHTADLPPALWWSRCCSLPPEAGAVPMPQGLQTRSDPRAIAVQVRHTARTQGPELVPLKPIIQPEGHTRRAETL